MKRTAIAQALTAAICCPAQKLIRNPDFRKADQNGRAVTSAEAASGKCNMVFMDNHADAADYRTVMTRKPERSVLSCYYTNYYMFLRGFDAFK